MRIIPFHTAPSGDAYRYLINELIDKTDRFFLVDRRHDIGDTPAEVARVFERLKPYLIECCTTEEMMMRTRAFYTEGIYYIYECTPAAGQILKEEADGFLDWLYPSLPEDLCFLNEDGSDHLYTEAHEDGCGMRITEQEARDLMKRIPGLMFIMERFPS
ncbi:MULTISPECIES: hypothetical protein [Paenibacillus]|uniref:hypothetical protein n=1 Tax=Paenibacillus illinoisensis TaxID=59845 RepID=UPI001C8D1A7D|nr:MULTISPECIES: hypothetical protein [Paenibacillus]MBY0220524.1 hypothetical protein [Paenibacillus illinoisensis]MCM3207756.1 hypothetical protein [Paenibacillus illinoisensis]WJH28792.1 hypothetical protein N6H13_28185 [Paenibacillus sp. CC-CFT742]